MVICGETEPSEKQSLILLIIVAKVLFYLLILTEVIL